MSRFRLGWDYALLAGSVPHTTEVVTVVEPARIQEQHIRVYLPVDQLLTTSNV